MTLHRLSMAAASLTLASLTFAGAAGAQSTGAGGSAPPAVGSAAVAPPSASSPHPEGFTPDTAKAFFTQYCITCHNQYAKIGDMVLDTRDFESIAGDAE